MSKRNASGPLRVSFTASPIGEDAQVTTNLLEGQTLPASWSSDAWARWFFDFLRTDLSTLTPGQLLGMRADVWVFVQPEIVVKSWGDDQLPPKEKLEALQRDAQAGIRRVREGGWFELEVGIAYGIARLGNRIIKGSRRGTFEDLFVPRRWTPYRSIGPVFTSVRAATACF